MTETKLLGIHHVVLSVRDVEASVNWYRELLDFGELFRFDTDDFKRVLVGHRSGVVVGLTQHFGTETDSVFNPRNPGLDHLAFTVDSLESLQAWADRLDAAGVEHSGIRTIPQLGSTLIDFKDPDGIQLELYLN